MASSILFLLVSVIITGAFIFILIHTQKENCKIITKLIITNINENHKANEYKKLLKLFFNDMTNISDFDPSLLNVDYIEFKSNNSIIYEIK